MKVMFVSKLSVTNEI